MKIFAHRGYSALYPENTVLSFSKAVSEGADGIELDVHLSKDGEVMVIHDESIDRTCKKKGNVRDYNRSELERIKVKGEWEGVTVPSLEEVLSLVSSSAVLLNVELKTYPYYYPSLEEKVLHLVRKLDMEKRVIYSSFNWLSVFRMKELGSTSSLALLSSLPAIGNIGYLMKDLSITWYHPALSTLTKESVEELKGNKRKVNVWTVDSEKDVKVCKDLSVDAIITNDLRAVKTYIS